MSATRVNGMDGWWEPDREVTEEDARAVREHLIASERLWIQHGSLGSPGAYANGVNWNYHRLAPEDKLPVGSQNYLALLDEMKRLHRAKAAGYAGADNADVWANFREAENWGATALDGCLIRLGDKFRRAQNLHRSPTNDQVNEPLRETLMDLAAYALIAICLEEEK